MLSKINKMIMFSLKNKEKEKVLVLKGLKSSLLNNEKEKNILSEGDVVLKYYNSTLKARDQYKDKDRIEKINFELSILKEFLPKQMSREEVLKEIEILKSKGFSSFPTLMKEIVIKTKGKFPSKELVILVKGNL